MCVTTRMYHSKIDFNRSTFTSVVAPKTELDSFKKIGTAKAGVECGDLHAKGNDVGDILVNDAFSAEDPPTAPAYRATIVDH